MAKTGVLLLAVFAGAFGGSRLILRQPDPLMIPGRLDLFEVRESFRRVHEHIEDIEGRLRKLESTRHVCHFDLLAQTELGLVREDVARLKEICEPLAIAAVVEDAWAKASLLRSEARSKAEPNVAADPPNRLEALKRPATAPSPNTPQPDR